MRWKFVVLFLVLPVFVACMLFVFRTGASSSHASAPSAMQGVLDLHDADWSARPTISLRGEWDFFWRRLLTPEDLSAVNRREMPDALLNLPNGWRGTVVNGQVLDDSGFATLRLRLLNFPADRPMALRLNTINAAYRLWANGRLIVASGRLGTDASEEQPRQALQLVTLPAVSAADPHVDLVLQTSRFHFLPHGFGPLEIGPEEAVRADQNRRWAVAMLVAGTLLLMGIYHCALFVFRHQNRAALFFGVCALAWAVEVLCIETDWAIRLFFPELSSELLFRCYRFLLAVAPALGFQFFGVLYPQHVPRRLIQIFWVIAALAGGLALFASADWIYGSLGYFYAVTVARMLFSFWGLSMAARAGRDGAFIILSGYVVFCLLGVNDLLYDLGLIRTVYVMQFGMLSFMLAQALALAQYFSRLFSSVEELSVELVAKNELLEREVCERVRVQQDIVRVAENERSRISHELHDGLCQQLTGARLLCSLLDKGGQQGALESGKELGRLSSILEDAVEYAYDLSRGLWPVESVSNNLSESLAALATRQAQGSSVRINFSHTHGCRVCECLHAAHMHSIAREAIVNARKHARPQHIEVELHCHPGDGAVLTVSDDGQGVERRVKPREQERRGWAGGNGLGVRIMTYRARMVGGDFRLEPREQGGMRAVCALPCPGNPVLAAATKNPVTASALSD